MGRINSSSLTWNEAAIWKKRKIDEGNGTRMETEHNGQFAFQDPLTTLRTSGNILPIILYHELLPQNTLHRLKVRFIEREIYVSYLVLIERGE
jgi:hypothetical protein